MWNEKMQIIKNQRSTLQSMSQIMDNIVKDVANAIGYEKTTLLQNWTKAFSADYAHALSFDRIQTKKDGSVVLHIACDNSGIGMMLHYDKINIIEKLAKIVGRKMVTEVKLNAGK